MPNVTLKPFGSCTTGSYEYEWPALTLVAGAPLITGGVLGNGSTVIEKDGRATRLAPSLAAMEMFANVPTFDCGNGVPKSRPVPLSNCAQDGLFAMENVSF